MNSDADTKRRATLADFLKTRRARLRPEQFNLPNIGRRRTPGLRREEVAQLAGVGVSWYTWLEQGRDITVSDQVIERLAETLQLEHEERRHLFLLTRGMVPVANERSKITAPPPGLQSVLDALGIAPAYAVDHRFNLVAWNESASRVFGNFSLLTERERNRVWYLFLHPSSRQRYVNWSEATQHAIMNFRAAYDQYIGDEWLEHLLQELQQNSPEFRALWAQHDIQINCDFQQLKELNHPQVGHLSFSSATFIVPTDPPLHMTTLTPCTQDTKAKLETLGQITNLPALTI
jgi:transcriptional regulator with XRE-family HTH domain